MARKALESKMLHYIYHDILVKARDCSSGASTEQTQRDHIEQFQKSLTWRIPPLVFDSSSHPKLVLLGFPEFAKKLKSAGLPLLIVF